jgi:predicted RNA-binding Zn ribbon-like protein
LPRVAASIGARARESRVAADAAMAEALSLRAEIWQIADALREHRRADLGTVNAMVAKLPPQPPLLERQDAYLHDLPGDDLRVPLWPVVWSLTAVLTSADATRIGCCQAEGCGWFFVDESPNRSRMWSSSEVCGNRERARRAYAKRTRQKSRTAG